MTNTPEIKAIIKANRHLFWYTPEEKKGEISEDLLLETILNYGTLESSIHLIDVMGKAHVLNKLTAAKGRKKNNYYPEIYNFFLLYLKSNVQKNS